MNLVAEISFSILLLLSWKFVEIITDIESINLPLTEPPQFEQLKHIKGNE